ncbi:MAG: 6-carboxytetrahydropterin synthase QueD, partial [Bdellovibrio sp.]
MENPTSELLAKWVYDHAKKELPMLTRVSVA